MRQEPPHLNEVVERARELLGPDADRWLFKSNRHLAALSPYELAASPQGAKLVIRELEKAVEVG
jgi:hypothetical protein